MALLSLFIKNGSSGVGIQRFIHPPNQPTYSKDDRGALQLYQNPHVNPPPVTLPRGYTLTVGCNSLGSKCPIVQVLELDISGNNLGPEGAKAQQWLEKKAFPTLENRKKRCLGCYLTFEIFAGKKSIHSDVWSVPGPVTNLQLLGLNICGPETSSANHWAAIRFFAHHLAGLKETRWLMLALFKIFGSLVGVIFEFSL